ILDEPTNWLDPMMQKRLFAELKKRSANGVSILLSSHNLGEVEEYCDRVAFIKEGKVLAITDLNKMLRHQKIITTVGGQEIIHTSVQILEQDEMKRTFRYNGDSALLLKLLQEANPDDFTVNNESLEERFLNL
ncbi:ABC transporter ATP-binding protein, partial [Vibrio parahaemolyticus]|nr:ABC transporter ATP-binding protein [Vibrio parahaemolyticus]